LIDTSAEDEVETAMLLLSYHPDLLHPFYVLHFVLTVQVVVVVVKDLVLHRSLCVCVCLAFKGRNRYLSLPLTIFVMYKNELLS